MANWILFDRDASGSVVIAAMNGSTVEKQISTNDKGTLITFLKDYPEAGTFLVAKPDGSDGIAASELLPVNDEDDTAATASPTSATWYQFYRDATGQPVVVALDTADNGIEKLQSNVKEKLIRFFDRHPSANTFQLAPSAAGIPAAPNIVPSPPPPSLLIPYRGKGVLLEIGHGPGTTFDPGAVAADGTTEHTLNIIAANAAQKTIAQTGVPCTVIDTPQGSLHGIGRQAKDFDVFCSVHHNAFNQIVQGSEALVHKTKHDAPDRELASMIAKAVSTELGITLRRPSTGGVNADRNLAVLSGAEDTNVRASVLAEVYFMDVPSIPDKQNWSERGGQAIGRAILDWLTANP